MDPIISHLIAAIVGALAAWIGLEKRRKRGVTSAAPPPNVTTMDGPGNPAGPPPTDPP